MYTRDVHTVQECANCLSGNRLNLKSIILKVEHIVLFHNMQVSVPGIKQFVDVTQVKIAYSDCATCNKSQDI